MTLSGLSAYDERMDDKLHLVESIVVRFTEKSQKRGLNIQPAVDCCSITHGNRFCQL